MNPRLAEGLKERAKVSDTVWQEGAVPWMTKREYARWCEGVSFVRFAVETSAELIASSRFTG